jgi:dihydroorotate dehydrogenase (NAD+) catalytic subunit
MKPLYDLTRDFKENVSQGLQWEGAYPELSHRTPTYDFLGKRLNSLFGIAACPMTHGAQAVGVCSKLGYDIITYRSVRSIEWHGQPYPQWRYVSIDGQLRVEDLSMTIKGNTHAFDGQEVSMANSFGIQSRKPEEWQKDFDAAKRSLSIGQLLILSLMFTPETGNDVLADAETVANFAKDTTADVFELNLAHPNSGMKSLVYEDIQTSIDMCIRVKKVLGDRPLLAKIGYYKNTSALKEFMQRTVGVIAGVTSTNTYGMPIVDSDGKELFPGRPKAGVSGAAIRTLCMQQAHTIAQYKKDLGLTDFVVIGVGGVTQVQHIAQYLDIPVDAVQCAVGAYVDPLLASKYLKTLI